MVKERIYETIDEQVIVLHDKMFPLYIIKGDKNYLIDSGALIGAQKFYENINRALEETGSKTQGIQTLLLTHTHWDHTGASSFLQKKYGFNVICSHRGVELLESGKVQAFINRLNQDHKRLVGDNSDTVFERLDHVGGVEEGDRIHIDDSSYLDVFETPGHTRCSVSYLLEPWKILFTGDSTGVREQNGEMRPLFLSSYTQYEESIKKLMKLDVEILAFPHNRIIKGKERISQYFRQTLNRTVEIKEKIITALKEGEAPVMVADMLYRTEFNCPTVMGPKEALMVNLEAMAKTVQKECM